MIDTRIFLRSDAPDPSGNQQQGWDETCSVSTGRAAALTFREVSLLNTQRCLRWHGNKPWNLRDWAVALTGEVGELCNVLKKLKRLEDGIQHIGLSEEALLLELGRECADIFLYLDLLASHIGIDLPKEIAEKFNVVSQKYKFPERL